MDGIERTGFGPHRSVPQPNEVITVANTTTAQNIPASASQSGNSKQRRRDRMIATRLKDLLERNADEKSLDHEEGDQWADTLAKTMLKGAAVKGQVALIKEVVLRVEGRVRDRADDESLRNLSDEELIAIVRRQRGNSGAAPATPARSVPTGPTHSQSPLPGDARLAPGNEAESDRKRIDERGRHGVATERAADRREGSLPARPADGMPPLPSCEDWLREISPYAKCEWPRVGLVGGRINPITETQTEKMLIVPRKCEDNREPKSHEAAAENVRPSP
jgi:hypothetical protein